MSACSFNNNCVCVVRPCCCLYPFLSVRPSVRPSVRHSLQAYFDNSWMLTESLFAGLQGEEAFLRPPSHGLRHPMMFYYGHPAALYVNKLRAAGIVQVRAGLDWTRLDRLLALFTVGVVSAAVFRNTPLRLFAWRRRKLAKREDRLFS